MVDGACEQGDQHTKKDDAVQGRMKSIVDTLDADAECIAAARQGRNTSQ